VQDLSPSERRRSTNRRWSLIASLALGYLLCALIDRQAFLAVRSLAISESDWTLFFRLAGFLPTWLVLGAAMGLVDRASGAPPGQRAWPLIIAATASGLAAEAAKRLIGRERPTHHSGEYVFKPFPQGFYDETNLGMPSSHVAVAFGAAFMLIRIHPMLWPVAVFIAGGCAAQRVICGAHFLTDVYAAAVLAYAVTAGVAARLDRARNRAGRLVLTPHQSP
jgi:membrane-associated phospholipid phosphatase